MSPLPRDKNGRPTLPLLVHLVLQSVPVLGRAGNSFSPPSSTRDTGRLSTWGHYLGPNVLGVNPMVMPKKGSAQARKMVKNAVTGLLAERQRYFDDHKNLFRNKHEMRRAMRRYDLKVLLPKAREKNIPLAALRRTQGSTLYESKRKRKGYGLGGGGLGDSLGSGGLGSGGLGG